MHSRSWELHVAKRVKYPTLPGCKKISHGTTVYFHLHLNNIHLRSERKPTVLEYAKIRIVLLAISSVSEINRNMGRR